MKGMPLLPGVSERKSARFIGQYERIHEGQVHGREKRLGVTLEVISVSGGAGAAGGNGARSVVAQL